MSKCVDTEKKHECRFRYKDVCLIHPLNGDFCPASKYYDFRKKVRKRETE